MAKKTEAEKYQRTCEQIKLGCTHFAVGVMALYGVTVEPLMVVLRYLLGCPTDLPNRKDLLRMASVGCKNRRCGMMWDETAMLFPRVKTCVVYVNTFGSKGANISMIMDMKTGDVLKFHITPSG